jgi:putative cell wall-binding protein
LVLSLSPTAAYSAFALDDTTAQQEQAVVEQSDEGLTVDSQEDEGISVQSADTMATVAGDSTIWDDGTYKIANGASGTITILNDVKVTLVGNGINAEAFKNLHIIVGDNAELTIQDVRIDNTDITSAIRFDGAGWLNVKNKNLIDYNASTKGGKIEAAINVGPNAEVVFGGDGTLYGFKSAMGAYIGASTGEVNGKITFESGTWCLAGSQVGAVIGSDSSTQAGSAITINGGALYLKTKAMGAAIGSSNQGIAPDVYVNGGLLDVWTDWQGSAIGNGGGRNGVGKLVITGGSVKTTCASNGASSWGCPSGKNTVTSAVITASIQDANGALLSVVPVDTSLAGITASDTFTVKVDGSDYYTGTIYQKSVSPDRDPGSGLTVDRTLDTPQSTLYFYLKQGEDHTIDVKGTTYVATWNTETSSFDVEVVDDTPDYSWYTSNPDATTFTINDGGDLAGLANIVNGAAALSSGDITTQDASTIAQDSFKGKTITLSKDLDISGFEEWSPIGNATYAFEGTLDGAGYTISGLNITSATNGYTGLFGNNAGTIKNFTLEGSIGSEESLVLAGADNVAAVVGRNAGTIEGVTNKASVYVYGTNDDGYCNGGIAGFNDGGTISKCTNEGSIVGHKAVGGIAGRNIGTVSHCVNKANVTANGTNKTGVGGIVGLDANKGKDGKSPSRIEYCYNLGDITSVNLSNGELGSWIGGIAGLADSGSVIVSCYDTGKVSGYNFVNAIVGQNEGSVNNSVCLEGTGSKDANGVYNAKYDGDKSGTSTNCYALSAADLKGQKALNILGSEYTVDSISVNDGYPVFAYTIALDTQRIAGNTRVLTAIEIAKNEYGTAKGVILATANNFPDALAGSSLAGALGYPVLLVSNNESELAAVQSEIEALGAKQVIVLGGKSVVSDSIMNRMAAAAGDSSPERLSGGTRYETAQAIYEYGKKNNLWKGDPIIVTGSNYVDALSISAYAAAKCAPILLASGDASGKTAAKINNVIENVLTADYKNNERVIIVGGTSAVDSSIDTWIKKNVGVNEVKRIAGDTRYTTSAAVVDFCVSEGMTTSYVGVAVGTNYPDGLAMGPAVAKHNGVLAIINGSSSTDWSLKSVSAAASITGKTAKLRVAGGVNAVTENVLSAIESKLS